MKEKNHFNTCLFCVSFFYIEIIIGIETLVFLKRICSTNRFHRGMLKTITSSFFVNSVGDLLVLCFKSMQIFLFVATWLVRISPRQAVLVLREHACVSSGNNLAGSRLTTTDIFRDRLDKKNVMLLMKGWSMIRSY